MYKVDDWKRGVDLSRARQHFATPEQQEAYADLSKGHSGIEVIANVIAAATGNQDQDFGKLQERAAQFSDLNTQLKRQLLHWLSSEILIALGFSYPRQPDDLPCLIPIDLWAQSVGWDKSKVEGNGLRIDAVRILHPQWIGGTESTESSKSPGRPSKVPMILEAYESLLGSQKIDFSAPKKSAVRQIRDWISTNHPDQFENGKGLGDEVIRRTIAERFDNDKNNKL